jgi:hypothetical protein
MKTSVFIILPVLFFFFTFYSTLGQPLLPDRLWGTYYGGIGG